METANESAHSERGKQLFDQQLLNQRSDLDRLFSKLLLVQWVAAIVVAVVWSPTGWQGKQQPAEGFLAMAIIAGGLLALTPLVMTRRDIDELVEAAKNCLDLTARDVARR